MADISKVTLPDNETYDLKDSVARSEISGKVNKSGDTMTGSLKLKGNQYTDSYTVGGLDANNSNIVGVNGLYFADASDGAGEAINFYRDATHADSIHAYNGALYFTPNRQLGNAGTSKRVIVDGSTFPEAYLSWGGRNFSASYGPIDAAMVDYLGANRFAFLKAAGITVEYTRDNGETWIDYGLTDAQKVGLFSTTYGCVVGKSSNTDANRANANCQLRVTIDTNLAKCYTVLNKFIFYVSTTGSGGSWASLDVAKHGDPNTWTNIFNKVGIGGWSGYNVINTGGITTYGNSNSQYQYLRFTFGIETQSSSYAGLSVSKIMAYGGVGWTTASNMATHGHLYSFDSSQNATFPAKVTATEFSGTVATSNLSGTVPIANGGTGAITASAASNNLLSGLPDWTAVPTDDTKLVRRDTAGAASFGQVKFSTIWSYIKSKADAFYATTSDIPTKTSDLTNDSGFITTETDPTVPAWAKASTKPTYTAAEVGAVPTSRTVNGKALSSNISLTASDVGALGSNGDASNTTATFTQATSRNNIATGTTIATAFSRISKWLADLGSLAFKSSVAKTDLASDVQTSLGKADTALQSYTETDPTVPSWAKASTKPTYTASEVGALPSTTPIPAQVSKLYTATCPTAAATTAKVATLDDSTGFSLAAGVRVAVTFTYGNTATTPTLNVGSSGAKTIAIPSSATAFTTGSGTTYNTWGAYETVIFTYTGTYWTHDTSGRLGYLAYSGLGSKANTASPTFTGTPAAPTATAGTNSTQIATTAFVQTALGNKLTYGDTDLTAGTSTLAEGVFYAYYE